MHHSTSAHALPRRRVIDARYEPVVVTTLPALLPTTPPVRPVRPLRIVAAGLALAVAFAGLFVASFLAGWSR